jgi:hypothetical protein
MIEVNRRLYMDERSGRKLQEFDNVAAVVARLITHAAEAALHDIWTGSRAVRHDG